MFLGHNQGQIGHDCSQLELIWMVKLHPLIFLINLQITSFHGSPCSLKNLSVLMDFNHLSVMSWLIHGLNHSSVSMFEWFANCEQLVGCEQPERS